jgi:3-dehydroquinate dehydratase
MDRTNAERQARYRLKMRGAGVAKRIHHWIDAAAFDRVTKYAEALGWSKMRMLEQMIIGYRLPRVRLHISKKTRRHKLRAKSEARP